MNYGCLKYWECSLFKGCNTFDGLSGLVVFDKYVLGLAFFAHWVFGLFDIYFYFLNIFY